MTRNELKQLIRQTLEESRVRSSPVGYNAAIRAAAEKFKEKEDEKAAAKGAEDATLAQIMSQSPNLSGKIKNIQHRISVLDNKIVQLENQIGDTENKTPEEILEMIPTLKSKTQFEIDRLGEYMNLQNALKELAVSSVNSPSKP
jgi:predicted RNase H-like nuclease (RuvC/YqgF family)